MTSPFAARRKAKVVGQDDEPVDTPMTDTSDDTEVLFKRPSSKAKKRSSMRVSFGPSGTEEDEPISIVTPKKSSLSRLASEKASLRKSASLNSLKQHTSSSLPSLPQRTAEVRPNYSKEHLAELKSSTPSTPRQQSSEPEASHSTAVDIAAKFGTGVAAYETRGLGPSIPTDAEIQEKKARRARLAQTQKHAPAPASDDSDSDRPALPEHEPDSDEDEFRSHRDKISLHAGRAGAAKADKYAPTRLVRDDEDLMEDFDAFVEDGRVQLGRRAERAAAARHKAEMKELIDGAEGPAGEVGGSGDESSSTDGERARMEEYEAAQTRKGMEGLQVGRSGRTGRGGEGEPKTPAKITPIPTLAAVRERLSKVLAGLERGVEENVRRLEEVEREREEIRAQEEAVQGMLNEVGRRYRESVGEGGEVKGLEGAGVVEGMDGMERGLESLGGTPVRGLNGNGL